MIKALLDSVDNSVCEKSFVVRNQFGLTPIDVYKVYKKRNIGLEIFENYREWVSNVKRTIVNEIIKYLFSNELVIYIYIVSIHKFVFIVSVKISI